MGYKIMNKRAKVENYTGLAKSNPCQGILLELSNITRDNATNGSFCLKQPQKKQRFLHQQNNTKQFCYETLKSI